MIMFPDTNIFVLPVSHPTYHVKEIHTQQSTHVMVLQIKYKSSRLYQAMRPIFYHKNDTSLSIET